QVGDTTNHEIQQEANDQEASDVADVRRLDGGEFLTPVPADGQQQVHGQTLVEHIRKLEAHLQDRNQKPKVEEQQQRREQVVGEVMPELMQHWSVPESARRGNQSAPKSALRPRCMRPTRVPLQSHPKSLATLPCS